MLQNGLLWYNMVKDNTRYNMVRYTWFGMIWQSTQTLTETQEKCVNSHFINTEKCTGNNIGGGSDNLEQTIKQLATNALR